MPMKISFQGKLYLEDKEYYDLDKVREEIACMHDKFKRRIKARIYCRLCYESMWHSVDDSEIQDMEWEE